MGVVVVADEKEETKVGELSSTRRSPNASREAVARKNVCTREGVLGKKGLTDQMAISLFLILKTFFEEVDLWFLLVYQNKTSFFLIPTETRVTEFPIEIRVRHLLLTVFSKQKISKTRVKFLLHSQTKLPV